MNASGKAIVSVLIAVSICLLPFYNNPLIHPTQAGTTIYVDASATGANDGTSWQDAFTSLQSALSIAVNGDEIWVAAGTYLPGANRAATFQLISGVEIYGGFPVEGGDFGSRDPEANPTILSGDIGTPGNNADNSYHVVTGSGTDATAVLDGFIISSGNANSTAPNDRGGGMYINAGSPTIKNCKFTDNDAFQGGALFNGSNSQTLLENLVFISNQASITQPGSFANGGAVYNYSGNLTIKDVDFIDNNASGLTAYGGSVYNHNGGLIIVRSLFLNNIATSSSVGGYGGGGGIYSYYGDLLIINSYFSENSSVKTNYDNSQGGGGGIFSLGDSLIVMNSTFYSNSATAVSYDDGKGGAILTVLGTLDVINSTFTNNHAQLWGHAIQNSASNASVSSSIFWGNSNPPVALYGFPNNSVNYSIVEGGFMGTGNIDADPKFINIGIFDLRLQYSSPAIDAGDNNSFIPDTLDLDNDGDITEPIPIDLDGNVRFFEMPIQPNVGNGDFPLVDMGAYEVYNSAPALDNSGDPHLLNILEDQGTSPGTLVSDLIASGAGGDPITDPDPSPMEGIAVIGADNGNGYWQYSIDGGTSWSNLGSPSNAAAVLIGDDPADRIRFIPNLNFNGSITNGLTFRAWDRSDGFLDGSSGVNLFVTGGASPYSSATETASITVLPVNDPPTMNSVATQTVYEDSGTASVSLTGIGSGDPDESQTITITASSNNPGLIPNPILDYESPETTATLSYEPVADQYGTATITVIVMDDGGTENGGSDTLARTFQIVVNPVNDAPYFDKGSDPVVLEDSGQKTITGWATNISPGPPNEASQTLTFILTPDNPGLFSVQPAINAQTGTLTFTPAQNATGSTPVTVVLKDNGGTSNGGEDSYTRVFTISIDPVNDPPSFVAGLDPVVLEDSGTQTIDNWASSIMPGPPDENWQSLSFTLTPDDTGLFASPLTINSSTGDLSFTPATDAIGSSSVLVELVDNGGTANGGSDTFTTSFEITIEPVNDPPSVSLGEDPTVSEDSGTQIFSGWATNITPGPDDEALQSLTFSLTADNPSLFASQPTIQSSTGTLSFSTAPNANGVTEINMTLKDSGGTANGGDDASTYTFAITVNPVNDKPEVTTFSKTGLWNQLLDFSSSDFGSNFTDIDGDDLTRVKITSLPTHGTLLVNGTSVSIGQEILYSDLDLLAFNPSAGWEGMTSLGWNGSDGTEYSSADAEVDITISSVIIPPIAKQLFVPLVLFNKTVAPPPSPTPTPTATPTPTPTLVPTPTPTPPPPTTWINIMTEDFEGSFPSGWQLEDNYGAGEYLWAKRNCRTYAGSYSGWAVGGGANGSSLSCGSDYPDDADSMMIYGPFSLQGATAAFVDYKLWLYSEYDYDWLCVGASLDNVDYYGDCFTGNSSGWIADALDLSNVYELGSLLNKPQVWIEFYFFSDDILNYSEGAYVDNIVLRKCESPTGCPGTISNLRAPIIGNLLVKHTHIDRSNNAEYHSKVERMR